MNLNKRFFKLDSSIDKHIDDALLQTTLNITTLATSAITITSCITNIYSGNSAIAITEAMRGIGIFLFFLYAKRTGNLSNAVVGQLVVSMVFLTALMLLSGGLGSLHLYWLIIIPSMVLMLLSRRLALLVALVIGLTLVGVLVVSGNGDLPSYGNPEGGRRAFSAILSMAVMMLVSHMTLGWRDQLADKIEKENAIKQSEHARKTRFFVHMNHEIRNPLNALVASIDLLKLDDELIIKGGLSTQEIEAIENRRSELIAAMKSTSVHVQSIVNDVLEIERLESSDAPESNRQFSLREFGNDLIGMLIAKAIAANSQIVVRFDAQMHDAWIGNVPRMRQVLLNLTSNALQHAEAREVSVTFSDTGTGLAFEVKDNGRGMSKETLEQMFQPFTSGIPEIGFSGLGLGICKRLVEKTMGGEIIAHSELGEGTVFTVKVPMAKAPSDDQPEITSLVTKKKDDPGSTLLDGSGLSMLMVEDSPEISGSMKLVFERRGFTVELASTSQEAVAIADRRSDFSIVLVDLNLGMASEENGIALTSRLVQMGLRRIIGFTGNLTDQVDEDWRAAGVSSIIQKPASNATLMTEIARVMTEDKGVGHIEITQSEAIRKAQETGSNVVPLVIPKREDRGFQMPRRDGVEANAATYTDQFSRTDAGRFDALCLDTFGVAAGSADWSKLDFDLVEKFIREWYQDGTLKLIKVTSFVPEDWEELDAPVWEIFFAREV